MRDSYKRDEKSNGPNGKFCESECENARKRNRSRTDGLNDSAAGNLGNTATYHFISRLHSSRACRERYPARCNVSQHVAHIGLQWILLRRGARFSRLHCDLCHYQQRVAKKWALSMQNSARGVQEDPLSLLPSYSGSMGREHSWMLHGWMYPRSPMQHLARVNNKYRREW